MRRPWTVLGLLYVGLLGASHAARAGRGAGSPPDPFERAGRGSGRTALALPAMGEAGPLGGESARRAVSVLSFPPHRPAESEPAPESSTEPAPGPSEPLPVLLLHGSPGSAANFDELGPALASTGRAVHALDLPGFGRSEARAPSYSILAHARAALAALDELGLARAHVVTWSMGGGVGLHMADLAPERVASLSQLASIGVQAAEGSGDYYLEHAKYALLFALVEGAAELVPHFGHLDPPDELRSFVRNFWDTDQRPLRAVLRGCTTPTLILHGRDDFLVPLWAAEVSHELMVSSRLVVLDGGHFLPFPAPHGELEPCLAELVPFLARHDRPGAPEANARVDTAPPRTGLAALVLEPFALQRRLHQAIPWGAWPWIELLALAALAARAPVAGPLALGLGSGGLQLDFGLAALAVLLGGLCAGSRRAWRSLGGVGLVVLGAAIGGLLGFAWSQLMALPTAGLALVRAARPRRDRHPSGARTPGAWSQGGASP